MVRLLANTITPALSSSLAYLFILNAGIGLLEIAILRRWLWGDRRARSTALMILANYVSAWAGLFILARLVEPRLSSLLGARPIERVNAVAGLLLAAAFLLSVLLELGFVYFAIVQHRRSLLRALAGSLYVNAASYVLIALWFMSIAYTLPFNARLTKLAQMGPLPQATLYWVDPSGQVMARRLDSASASRRIGQVIKNDGTFPFQLRIERLANSPRFRIDVQYGYTTWADRPTTRDADPPDPTVLADGGRADVFPAGYWEQDRDLTTSVLDLRQPMQRRTSFTFDWYRHCLITKVPGGPRSTLCIDLLLLPWGIQEPTVLPDEKVVFEWERQIVLFDPLTARIAFIAPGTCPAIVPADE